MSIKKITFLGFLFIFIIVIVLALLRFYGLNVSLSTFNKMPPIIELCALGKSVEVCTSGDYHIGRLNMKKDGDTSVIYDKDGNFLCEEGGLGVAPRRSWRYFVRENQGKPIDCTDYKLICR